MYPRIPWEVVASTLAPSVRAVGTAAIGCRCVDFTNDPTYYRSSVACITCRRMINGTDRRSFGVVTFYLGSLERSCWWSSYWCDNTYSSTHEFEFEAPLSFRPKYKTVISKGGSCGAVITVNIYFLFPGKWQDSWYNSEAMVQLFRNIRNI
jgi:hypothetical protein